jgi:hypothetical protein
MENTETLIIGDIPRREKIKAPKITINGTTLTRTQALTVRCALLVLDTETDIDLIVENVAEILELMPP